jgi:serine beta-lactamase-like protein LACTB
MTRKLKILSLVTVTSFLAAPSVAQDSEEVAAYEAIQLFEAAVASPSVPGISVALAGRDGVIWAKGFGYADLENNVKMSIKTKMRFGSVAKVVATAGLMRLYDQGKIDLDAPIITYVPSWPAKHPTITLRQLTSHTSGVRHYKGDEFMMNVPYSDVTTAMGFFKDDPLNYAPGTGHSYSTLAWTVVSAAMEGADHTRDFKAIIRQEVFTPLGLNDTSFDEQYTIIPNRQRPYSWYEGELVNTPQTDHSYKWAGGGFISSTSDTSRFAMAHFKGSYLKQETLDEMHTPAKLNDGTDVPFGIGWMTGWKRSEARYKNNAEAMRIMSEHPNSVMHSGGSAGGITMMILCKTHGRAVTVVKNVDSESSANVFLLALKTLDLFHK